MRTVFADTQYWIAIVRPDDPWAESAGRAKAAVGNVRLLTTDEVLNEFLTGLRNGGATLRRQAVKMVRAILDNPNVTVIPQSRDSFLQGIALYEQCADKTYSLTDCISMNAMRKNSVTEILSNDRHFEQAGFKVLMTR